ncbi:hypothetical protein Tco_0587709 [Tanacetum coccineum]
MTNIIRLPLKLVLRGTWIRCGVIYFPSYSLSSGKSIGEWSSGSVFVQTCQIRGYQICASKSQHQISCISDCQPAEEVELKPEAPESVSSPLADLPWFDPLKAFLSIHTSSSSSLSCFLFDL